MSRKPIHYKYKLLLDENFLERIRLPLLNGRYDVKHIRHDFKKVGLSDPEVYALAAKEKRLVVTFNDKDFIDFAMKNKNSGVIGISTNMSADQIDKKLAAILRKAKRKDIYGKFTYISRES